VKLSNNNEVLDISINKSLSTVEVESLISDLAEFRAKMEPAVPMDRPGCGSKEGSKNVMLQDEPTIIAKLLKDGQTRFWLRSHGLGWLVFNFTVSQSIMLRDFFIANTSESDGAPSLFSDDRGNSGPTH